MKTLKAVFVMGLVLRVLGPVIGQPGPTEIEKKYGERLRDIFQFQARIAKIHPSFQKVYPIAIVENKTFYVFEPVPNKKEYRLAFTAPDTFNIPKGIRAAMPLGFWNNRMACVVTGEIFEEPDGFAFIFHEFVHCAEWECCEPKLKEKLAIFREAMKKKDYMWELQFPFPYADKTFAERYAALIEAWDKNDQVKARSLRAELKKGLAAEAWEYMTWQEWKEGLARYLENRIRKAVGLPENTGGKSRPFNRVAFYHGGNTFIGFLERQTPRIADNLEELYRLISAS
jgi:hypothetical protein